MMADLDFQLDTPRKRELHLRNVLHRIGLCEHLGAFFLTAN